MGRRAKDSQQDVRICQSPRRRTLKMCTEISLNLLFSARFRTAGCRSIRRSLTDEITIIYKADARATRDGEKIVAGTAGTSGKKKNQPTHREISRDLLCFVYACVHVYVCVCVYIYYGLTTILPLANNVP